MSKSRKKIRVESDYDDGEDNYYGNINSVDKRRQRRYDRALKTMNIDELMVYDEDGVEVEQTGDEFSGQAS